MPPTTPAAIVDTVVLKILTNVNKLKNMISIQAGERFGQLDINDLRLDYNLNSKK